MKKRLKIVFMMLFVFLGVFFITSSEKISENENTKLVHEINYANNNAEYETGKYEFGHDEKQMVYFAIRYVDKDWSMNDLAFTDLSMSSVAKDEAQAEENDVVIMFSYAMQEFYLYGEQVRAHHREYRDILGIQFNFFPTAHVVKCSNGYEYAGYSIHTFSSKQKGVLPIASKDKVKSAFGDTHAKKPDGLDVNPYIAEQTVTPNRSVLVNLYFEKPLSFTFEIDDKELADVSTDENIADYQDGSDLATIYKIPRGIQGVNGISINGHHRYQFYGEYKEIHNNKIVKKVKRTDNALYLAVKDGYYADLNDIDKVIERSKSYDVKFYVNVEPKKYDISLKVKTDVIYKKGISLYATFGDYTSEPVEVNYGENEYELIIKGVPHDHTGKIQIYYKGKYENIFYGNYIISKTPLSQNTNETTLSKERFDITDEFTIEGYIEYKEPVAYLYQQFAMYYKSNQDGVEGLPSVEYALCENEYIVSTKVPESIPEGYEFLGYGYGKNVSEKVAYADNDRVFMPVLRTKVFASFYDYDSTLYQESGYKYLLNIKDDTEIVWDNQTLPEAKGILNHVFVGWVDESIDTPYGNNYITSITQVDEDDVYYALYCHTGIDVYYIANTNDNVHNYNYHNYHSQYAQYLLYNPEGNKYFSEYYINAPDPGSSDGIFLGWSKVKDDKTNLYNYGDKLQLDGNPITLYAVYERKQLTLSIDLDGGSFENYETNVKGYNLDSITLPIPYKEGYTFSKWEFVTTSVGKLVGDKYTFSTDDDYIKAVYKVNKYDVKVNVEDLVSKEINFTLRIYDDDALVYEKDSIKSSTSSTYKVSCEYDSNIVVEFVLEGSFRRYNLSIDEITKEKKEKLETSFTLKDNKEITLKITELYTITFNGNDSDNDASIDKITMLHGETIELPTNPFIKEGYVADGWSTSKDGTSGRIDKYSINQSATLYSYYLTYITFYATSDEVYESITAGYGNPYSMPTTPINGNLEFLGWASSDSATTPTWTSGTQNYNDKKTKWYAVWKDYHANENKEDPSYYARFVYSEYGNYVDLYSYNYTPYKDVICNYNYNKTKKGALDFSNATINGETVNKFVLPSSMSGYCVGVSTDKNSLDIMYEIGDEISLNENITIYAIRRVVEDVVKEESYLTHRFYLSENNYFEVKTKMVAPTSGKVYLTNYDKTVKQLIVDDTDYGKTTYEELLYQEVMDKSKYPNSNYDFAGWSINGDTTIDWDYKTSKITPTESSNYYAVYYDYDSTYSETQPTTHRFYYSEDKYYSVETTLTKVYSSVHYANYNDTLKTLSSVGSINGSKTSATPLDFVGHVSDDDKYEFLGWSKYPTSFDNIWRKDSKQEWYDTTWYAIYKEKEHTQIVGETNAILTLVYDSNTIEKQTIKAYIVNNNVINYCSYDLKYKKIFNPGTLSYYINEDIELPVKDNIIGWSYLSNNIDEIYSGVVSAPTHLTYYAVYSIDKDIDVSYILPSNYDNIDETITVSYIASYDNSIVTNYEATYTLKDVINPRGYNFNSWSTSSYYYDNYNANDLYTFNILTTDTLTFYGTVDALTAYNVKDIHADTIETYYENEEYTFKEVSNIPTYYNFDCYIVNDNTYYPNDKIVITSDIEIQTVFVEYAKYIVNYLYSNKIITHYVNDEITLEPFDKSTLKEKTQFVGYMVNDTLYQENDKIIVTSDLVIDVVIEDIPTYVVSFTDTGENVRYYQGDVIVLHTPTQNEDNPFICWVIEGKEYAPGEEIVVNKHLTIKAKFKNTETLEQEDEQSDKFTQENLGYHDKEELETPNNELENNTNPTIFIVIGVIGGLALVSVAIFIIIKKRKGKKNEDRYIKTKLD